MIYSNYEGFTNCCNELETHVTFDSMHLSVDQTSIPWAVRFSWLEKLTHTHFLAGDFDLQSMPD